MPISVPVWLKDFKKAEPMTRKKTKLTFEDILEELEEARLLAVRNESPTAAISASLGKAKVLALLNDKNSAKAPVEETYKPILVEFV